MRLEIQLLIILYKVQSKFNVNKELKFALFCQDKDMFGIVEVRRDLSKKWLHKMVLFLKNCQMCHLIQTEIDNRLKNVYEVFNKTEKMKETQCLY